MLELPHAVVGAAIAAKVGNPALALPLAFASHFVLDMLPHWNPHLNTEFKKHGKIGRKTFIFILADSVLALAAGLFIAYSAFPDINRAMIILLGGFFGVLPDLVEAPYYFLGVKHPFFTKYYIPFKKSIQFDVARTPGFAIQGAPLLAALWWVFS